MWRNYLIIVYRNVLRQKLNTIINILGLAAGISAATLIFLYVYAELTYDENWDNPDDIYRINESFDYPDREPSHYAMTSHLVGKRLRESRQFNEVCRIETGNYGHNIYVNDTWLNPGNIKHVDRNFFNIFTYPRTFFQYEEIDIENKEPAWVSEDVYNRFFEPYKVKEFRYGTTDYYIVGTYKKKGFHSHLDIDILILYDSVMLSNYKRMYDWTRINSLTYVRTSLRKNELKERVDQLFSEEVKQFEEKANLKMNLYFPVIPLADIHFSQKYQYDSLSNSNKRMVWLFSVIGVLILTIASINYINMAIAQGGIRAREIAIRKTMGASRRNIIIQFLGESVAITFLAILASFIISELLFPAFNEITGYDFHIFDNIVLVRMMVFLGFVWIILGFFSGFYPAFVLSLFQPITIFRGGADLLLYRNVRSYFVSSTKVRKLMLIAQYLVAGTIIITTIIIQLQTRFLMNRDLGFDLDNLVIMELEKDTAREDRYKRILNNIRELDNVQAATLAERIPGLRTGRLLFNFKTDSGIYHREFDYFSGYPDYMEVIGSEIVLGRWFDPDGSRDEMKNEVLVNQAFVKSMNWKNPLGREFGSGFIDDHKVVGVLKNFNYYSLHNDVSPLVVLPGVFTSRYLVINSNEPRELIKSGKLQHLWSGFFPNEMSSVKLLKSSYNSQYTREHRLLSIFTYFSGLSIIISSLGLFALSAFSAQKRCREISIRKILGAGRKHILRLLYMDYMQIFALSTLLAWLFSFVFANQWLHSFIAAVSPGVIPYVFGGIIILSIVAITVSYHTVKALSTNPAINLKYE